MTTQRTSIAVAGPRFLRGLPRPSSGMLLPAGAALLLVYLTALPITMLVLGSLRTPGAPGLTLDNYVDAYGQGRVFQLAVNSFLYAFGTAALALTVGAGLAWIVERTNTPARRWLFALALVPLIIPGIVNTIAWIFLLSPRIGVINRVLVEVLGLEAAPFDIFTLGGMIWTEGLHLSPLVFLIMWGAFRSMDPALEESAIMSGAGTLKTLRRVTFAILLPAFAASWLIMFVRGLESFEVPALLGIPGRVPVFTSEIWYAFNDYPPDFGRAGALGMGLLAVSAMGVWVYHRLTRRAEKFATVTGKAFRPRVLDLGPWKWLTLALLILYFLVIVVMPMGILLWNSLLPFFQVPNLEALKTITLKNYEFVLAYPSAQRALQNSFLLAITAATLAMTLTAVIAWITTKTRLPGRAWLDFLAFIPITIPGLVLGVAMIWQYISFPLPIYGTLWVLIIAYVTKYLPYGMRTNSAAMLQIHRELEEAGAVAGASWWTMFRRITLPLLRSGFVAGWIYILVVSVRELSSSILLVSSDSIVLSVLVFDLFESGKTNAVAALSIMLIGALVVLVTVVQRVSGRVGIKD